MILETKKLEIPVLRTKSQYRNKVTEKRQKESSTQRKKYVLEITKHR